MLESLLNEIRAGGPLQPAALAQRLRVSQNMVVMMLEDLERMGKLSRVDLNAASACDLECKPGEPSSESACGACPVANLCLPKGKDKGRVWMVK